LINQKPKKSDDKLEKPSDKSKISVDLSFSIQILNEKPIKNRSIKRKNRAVFISPLKFQKLNFVPKTDHFLVFVVFIKKSIGTGFPPHTNISITAGDSVLNESGCGGG
jgi:hypothetical protein